METLETPILEADRPGTATVAADWLPAVVLHAEKVAEDTLLLQIESATNEPLPPYEAGAHVALQCGDAVVRHYSLTGPARHPGVYELGIKLAPESQGGSRWVFGNVAVGSRLLISVPRNNFPLHADPVDVLFVSGGIGITPIVSMLYALRAKGVRARLVHLCRSSRDLGFQTWLAELAKFHDIHLHFDSEAGAVYDIAAEIGRASAAAHVYCCGPAALMDAVRQHGEAAGFGERLHFEYFSAPEIKRDGGEDTEFSVVQQSTGRVIPVARTQTMLAALREAGIPMKSECEYGVCGWCSVGVIDGTPAHFDSYLTAAEKRANQLVLPCVSRCTSARITLDI